MKRRRWDAKTNARIVLEGLSGRSVAEICADYQISQVQYYQWRDKLLGEAYRAFENGGAAGEVTRLMKLTCTRHWDTGRRIRPNRDTNSVKIIS